MRKRVFSPQILVFTACVAVVCGPHLPATATTAEPQPSATRRVSAYVIESVSVQGTDRISVETLGSDFGLKPGAPLNDELVMNTRTRLMGLGLFSSVILRMTKGSVPGKAKLIVECEDDEEVLTDWALGGEMGVTLTETTARSAAPDGPPRGVRLALIGRNILSDQHRGLVMADLDAKGSVREAEFAYGLPRFGLEDTQFDTGFHVVDVPQRYLNAVGFGARGQAVWTQSLESGGDFLYGMAVYANRQPRYAVPGFPRNVSGPKIGYVRETRLRKFIAGPGTLFESSLLFAPIQSETSVAEMRVAKTFAAWHRLALTLELNTLAAGLQASSVRGETRLDFPLHINMGSGSTTDNTRDSDEQAAAFIKLRGGFDRGENTSLTGSAAIFGLRYHSSGFIAELALQLTQIPRALDPERLRPDEVQP